jgi:neutral ceramidase
MKSGRAEESELQTYEGASTHFGRWTLGAYQTSFDSLLDGTLEQGVEPPRFSDEDMAGRRFVEPPELVAKKCELPKGFGSGVHELDPESSALG